MIDIEIYCDIAFLSKFITNEPPRKKSWEPTTLEEEAAWSLSDFIFKGKIKIFINSSMDIQQYPFLQYFMNQHTQSQIQLKLDIDFQDIDKNTFYKNKTAHRLSLIEQTEQENTDLQKQFGFYYLNYANYAKVWQTISLQNLVEIKHDSFDWSKLDIYKHSLNGIVFIDRYFFKSDFYKKNIVEILQRIIFYNDYQFIIPIIFIYEGTINVSEVTKFLKKDLERIFKKDIFCFTFIEANSLPETHDRRIYTNYYYLCSGDSFTYNLEGKAPTNTKLHIYAFGNPHFNIALNDLKDIKINFVKNPKNRKILYPNQVLNHPLLDIY